MGGGIFRIEQEEGETRDCVGCYGFLGYLRGRGGRLWGDDIGGVERWFEDWDGGFAFSGSRLIDRVLCRC